MKLAVKQNTKNKFGQYFTPKVVADFMIEMANISQNSRILEPSCGEGVFLDLLKQKGFNNLTAFEIDQELAQEFEEEYNVDADYIKHNLYKEPNPNAYLATFAKFLIRHKDTEFCQKLIHKEMESFVENYIEQFDNCKEVPVHFIGSVAHCYKEILQEAAQTTGIQIGKILQSPMEGLIQYHQQ